MAGAAFPLAVAALALDAGQRLGRDLVAQAAAGAPAGICLVHGGISNHIRHLLGNRCSKPGYLHRRCERSEAIQKSIAASQKDTGLRRYARNDSFRS